MKKTAYLLAAIVLASAVPVFAQGPFTDVPTDHWAYDAVNTLQKDGVLIGYPDGTFGGKRTITRYEFAVAIARVVGLIPGQVGATATTGITQEQLNEQINALKSQIPNVSNLATKADVDALRKLIDEFRDELAALGVDVDALKRDVAALSARVEALEAEVRRVRFTGNATVFAISESSQKGTTVDLDERLSSGALGNDALIRDIALVKDFDLNIVGRVTDRTTANATINYGDYLNYLGFVDDYVSGPRPINRMGTAGTAVNPPGGVAGFSTLADNFFPYYLNIQSALGKGALTIGRLPIQFTPYTLKKIDVDSYTNILKTDDGNYPIDGAKLALNFGFVDLTLFAAKNDENAYLANGLTGQPNAGIYDAALSVGPLHQLANGHAVGGLTQVTQSAGVRAVAGIPWNGTLGATFYQAWDRTRYGVVGGTGNYDQARVFGADVAVGLPFFTGINFAGSWTRSDTLASNHAPTTVKDIDYQNAAWDGKFSGSFGIFGLGVGYKDIGRNFAAAGYWDKIGRWTNPTNVKGPYADLQVPIMSNLKFAANGEWLQVRDNFGPFPAGAWGNKDDRLAKAEGAIKWGFTRANSLDVSYQWIKFNPDTKGLSEATETYLTVGVSHQLTATTGLKVGYQFITYDDGRTGSGPYSGDYRGGLGVVQFGVTF